MSMVTVSIVSHGQGVMLSRLLSDLAVCPEVSSVIVTLNIPEAEFETPENLRGRLTIVRNALAKGFSANHNAAFEHCDTPFFCVLNPDVRIPEPPFPCLMAAMEKMQAVMAVPAVVNPEGNLEDSIRLFPTPVRLLRKVLLGQNGAHPFALGDSAFFPHWAAGMFMLFDSQAYAGLHGFDESYFLYYEDVDICARIWLGDMRLVACPSVSVVHAAQRSSHRSLKYLRWHVSSALRFQIRYFGRLPDPDPSRSGV